jgi:hypothetical protein
VVSKTLEASEVTQEVQSEQGSDDRSVTASLSTELRPLSQVAPELESDFSGSEVDTQAPERTAVAHATGLPEGAPEDRGTDGATMGLDDDLPIATQMDEYFLETVVDGVAARIDDDDAPLADAAEEYVREANRRHTPARRLAPGARGPCTVPGQQIVADVMSQNTSVKGEKYAVVVKDRATGGILVYPLMSRKAPVVMDAIVHAQAMFSSVAPGRPLSERKAKEWVLYTDGGGNSQGKLRRSA